MSCYGGLYLRRLLRFPRLFGADLIDHLRGPGFFTMVAGSSVLGVQCLIHAEYLFVAFGLWVLAMVLWLVLTYTIFTAFTIKQEKPSLEQGINGAWLLAVVSTQSIAVLGAHLAPHIAQPWRLEINFLALSMWLWGGMLYIWLMSLIFYRNILFSFLAG